MNEPSHSTPATRCPAMVMACAMLIGALLVPPGAHAGSIFDDDWTPPKSAKPAEPPPDATQAKPEKPPEPAKPDNAIKLSPTTVTPPVTAERPRVRRPIPAAAEQAKSRKLFKELFAAELADRSPAARRGLANKLMEQAGTVGDASADQFVLLVGATEAGREAGDLGLSCHAVDALAEAYDVDALHFKADTALKMSLRADSPAATSDNCRVGLSLVDQLVAAEDYATALRLLQALRAAAPDAALTAQIQSRATEVDAIRVAAERIAPSLQKLKSAPDDPAANVVVGEYLCFTREDWKRGLPYLAKGAKPGESAAAALDLAGPTDPVKQADVGDAWWDLAERETAQIQPALRQHAAGWYTTALASTAISGLKRAVLEKRLQQAAPPAPKPRLVNLLPLIDGEKDTEGGAWKIESGKLTSKKGTPCRLRIPYAPPDEYDFHIRFMRNENDDLVGQILIHSGHSFMWLNKCRVNSSHTLQNVGDGEMEVPVLPEESAKGRMHDSMVQVRKDGIVVYVDGRVAVRHPTDFSDMSIRKKVYRVSGETLGLVTWGTPTTFYIVEVTEISGPGTVLPHQK